MALLKCRKKTEHEIQKSIVRYFRKEYPNYILFSTNNEACYTRQTYFAEAGMLKGLADLVIVLPNKIIFVELKTTQGKQSKSQKDFETKITSLGYNYYIIKSLNDFKELIKNNL